MAPRFASFLRASAFVERFLDKGRFAAWLEAVRVVLELREKGVYTSYTHAPGTCTFYGTANSNQMLMEVMGLHLLGAAGMIIDWNDLDEISRSTPLRAHLYPNGQADVNHFHAAGSMGFVIRQLFGAMRAGAGDAESGASMLFERG